MPVYHEILPPGKSSKHSGIRWTPAEADYEPVAGVLLIDTDRARAEYLVTEFPTGWRGRGFHLAKLLDGGREPGESYDVFVGANGQDRQCCCPGFERFGHCKHCDAMVALIQNGWV